MRIEDSVSGRSDKRERPALNRMRITLDARSLIERFCAVTGHSEEELCCRGKRTTGRAHLMELLYRYCNLTQPEIGNLVGGVDYSAVSQARKRLRAKLAVDKKMQRNYFMIEQRIIKMSR